MKLELFPLGCGMGMMSYSYLWGKGEGYSPLGEGRKPKDFVEGHNLKWRLLSNLNPTEQ